MKLFQLNTLLQLRLKHLYFILLIVLFTGCTVGPDYHTPTEQLPSHYKATGKQYSSAVDNINWWNSLGDPLLVKLINQAVGGDNLDIQKAQATVRQARAALGVTSADLYPQLDANGKISRDHLSGNSEIIGSFPPGVIPLYYTDYQFGFDASWELDFFGYTRRSIEASKARLESDIENQNDVEITTAAEVARNYIQYRIDQQRILITKHTIASYVETAKLVNIQLEAGLATVADLHRVESEVLSAQASLPSLEAEAQATLNALAVMVGEYPETLSEQLNIPAPIPVINPKNISVGLPSDLLQQRPDVRSAERQLAAATADIGVATANEYPRFELVGDLGSDTVFPGTFTHAASRYWSIAPKVVIPLFQGGRLRGEVKENEAARDVALANYKKSILQALADVETAMVRYDNEQLREKNLRASYEKEQSVAKLIKIQYVDGQASLIDVLDVERQVNQLNDEYAQSLGQVSINLVSLYKSLGGAWPTAKKPGKAGKSGTPFESIK